MDRVRWMGWIVVWFLGAMGAPNALARWESAADELPDWAQRGRMIFLRWNENAALWPEFEQWKPILHLHGPRVTERWVKECVAKQIPLSLRVEAVMFFGDDRTVKKIRARAPHGWREHSWYWQYNWWVRDPVFREATLQMRDGQPMIEYLGNGMTERETVNPLHPLALRMRREVSRAVLTPQDARSLTNAIYPNFPYTHFDDVNFGNQPEPREYYPVFGHLSMLWYDNPNLWADASEFSQQIWRAHFRETFGEEIADPVSDPREAVRREWTRFWIDAYGRYFEAYYAAHQSNVSRSVVTATTTTGLNGKRVLPVGLNASAMSGPWGAQQLFLFKHYRATSFPGVLCEYDTGFTHGKFAPLIKFSMAAMLGRPTGYAATNPQAEAEALALNGINAYSTLTPRAKAYIRFQFDNRALFANAQQGNRVGIVYNVRTGLVSNTLIAAYELAQQLDEIGVPYDVIIEDDLLPSNAGFLRQYAGLLVPGGEFNTEESRGLERFRRDGGRVISLPQPISNEALLKALEPCLTRTYRLSNPQRGFIAANVLRQGETIIIGLVNYSGQPQHNLEVLLPDDGKFARAAVVSPDGCAERVEIENHRVVLPELYLYSAILLGEPSVLDAALSTVKSRLTELIAAREPPTRIQESGHCVIGPETILSNQQLSRLRAGTFETATFLMIDALAPRAVKVNKPVRVTMRVISTGSHYPSLATMDDWRVWAGDAGGEGVTVRWLDGDTPATMPVVASELNGKTLVADWRFSKPGRYKVGVAYRYHNKFAHGEPDGPLGGHSMRHTFPGLVIEVRE